MHLSLAKQSLLVVCLLVFLSACGSTVRMYEGEARDRSEVAVLRIKKNSFGSAMARPFTSLVSASRTPDASQFVSINGVEVEQNTQAVEVLPGLKTVLIQGGSLGVARYIKGPDKVEFEAEAGGEYVFRAVPSEVHSAWDCELIVKGKSQRSTPLDPTSVTME